MTIEPHDAITVCTPQAVCTDRSRTLLEYQSDVRKQFGGRLPSLAELAKVESRAVATNERRAGTYSIAPEHRAVLREAAKQRGERQKLETEAVVLELLTEPTSVTALHRISGRSHDALGQAMLRLEGKGLVARMGEGQYRKWFLLQEAAE